MSYGRSIFKKPRNFNVSFWISDAWYEVIDETRCYQLASITHRVKEDVLIISIVFLFFKVSFFIRFKV